jgi:hypothetical protein
MDKVTGETFCTYGRQNRCMYGFGQYNVVNGITWKSWHRWEKVLKIFLQDVECEVMDWIEFLPLKRPTILAVHTETQKNRGKCQVSCCFL